MCALCVHVRMCECVCACVYVYMYVCVTCVHVCDEHVCMCVMHMCVCVCMCVYVCTHVCGYVHLCEYICMCRPVARSENKGVRKTNVDLTSGQWPRWVARYEKGGWAVHFRADIRKVWGGGDNLLQVHYEKWGGEGGVGNSLQVHYEKWGGGGGGGNSLQVHYEKWGEGNSQKLHKPGPAPHKRTLTLLGGGGFIRTPRTPPWLRA